MYFLSRCLQQSLLFVGSRMKSRRGAFADWLAIDFLLLSHDIQLSFCCLSDSFKCFWWHFKTVFPSSKLQHPWFIFVTNSILWLFLLCHSVQMLHELQYVCAVDTVCVCKLLIFDACASCNLCLWLVVSRCLEPCRVCPKLSHRAALFYTRTHSRVPQQPVERHWTESRRMVKLLPCFY